MNIYQHFRKEEHHFIDRMYDLGERASEKHLVVQTDFLNPREIFIAKAVMGQFSNISVSFWGGYEEAERKRGLIYPDYHEPSLEDYKLELLHIEAAQPLQHRALLGSILGTGIKREKVGDLLCDNLEAQCLLAEEMSGFILLNLNKVGRQHVQVSRIPFSKVMIHQDNWQTFHTTVSSLRLDVIIAELLNLSRAKSGQLVRSGRVKVNWGVVDRPDVQLDTGDMLSVQGYGRFLFKTIEGETKKQRLRIELGKKVDS